jgi:hypothetical protein
MRLQRTVVLALVMALFSGQTLVAVQRAACAMPRGTNPPSCARCAGHDSSSAKSLNADRSCCAAAKVAPDRAPARIASERSSETRLLSAASLPAAATLVQSTASHPTTAFESPPPYSSPLHLRTTILLN